MHGHGHAQPAARLGQLVGGECVGGIVLGQDGPAALIVGAAELRQALPARGAGEEAHAQAVFEKAHVLADHGTGQRQRIGGRRKRAQVDRLDEDRHARQTIHIGNSSFLVFWFLRDLSDFMALA